MFLLFFTIVDVLPWILHKHFVLDLAHKVGQLKTKMKRIDWRVNKPDSYSSNIFESKTMTRNIWINRRF